MKKILATAAVLAFAGSAFAGEGFIVNGAVDFSGGTVAGGLGERLTWSGTADWGPFGGIWFGPAFTNTGFQLATPGGDSVGTGLVGDFELNPGDFAGAIFSTTGASIPSGTVMVNGVETQGVQIGHFGPGLSDFAIANGGSAYIQIEGENKELWIDADSGSGYALTFVPFEATGGTLMYVIEAITVPTPGAAGLLGLAGLAAVRRRR